MYSRKHGVISLSVSGFSLFDWLEDLSAGKQSTLGRPSAHQAWDHEPEGHNQRTYIYIYTQKNQHILCSHGQALEVDPTYDFCNPCPTNPSTLQGDKDRIGGLPRKGAAILEEV